MHIAYVSPLPPARSGVADYSADVLPWLRRLMRVDVYTSADHVDANCRRWDGIDVRPYEALPARHRDYDMAVYHLSCEECSIGPFTLFDALGGAVVLHDLNLSGLFGALTFGRDDRGGFFRQLWRQEGAFSCLRAITAFARTGQMPGTHDYWMSRGIIRRSQRVLVHNRWSREWILQTQPARAHAVRQINMGVPVPKDGSQDDTGLLREALGLPDASLVIGAFGIVDESKRFSAILDAFGQVLRHVPDALCIFVGSHRDEHAGRVAAMGLSGRVRLLGRVPMDMFYKYIAATDLCVALRYPTHGETSAPLLRIMSLGKPVVVTRIAQFDELPDDICGKISLDHERDELAAWLLDMSQSPARRIALGMRARDHVLRHHSLEAAAESYARALAHRGS